MLLNEIKELLKTAGKYFSKDDELLKNIVLEDTIKMDKDLIKLLISNEKSKTHFFLKIEDVFVFDKDKFIKFIENKEFLPNSYTSYKNKIGLTDSKGEFIKEKNDVVLSWAYKDCYLEGGQDKEDMKKDEIFYNEILAPDEIDRLLEPKVLTNFRKYDIDGEHKVEDITMEDNLIIKGNNLLALHSLKEKYAGKIKLIYIDPPYNTGSDGFKYNDDFNHSTWLTFMKNRLEIARELLSDEGFIFVQCDDNEQAYLKVLMDGIFKKENNRSVIYVETVYANKTLKQDRIFHDQIEQILIYAKSPKATIKQEFEDYNYDKFVWKIVEKNKAKEKMIFGNKKVEIFLKEDYEIIEVKPSVDGLKEIWASGTILDMNSSGRFFRDYLMNRVEDDGYNILYKVYDIGDDANDFRYFTGPKREGATKGKYYQGVPNDKIDVDLSGLKKKSIENLWQMAGDFGNCRSEGDVELKSGKKPEKLLKKIIELATEKNDIIIDYHLGSGTTCAVAHKMKRKYIGIEQMDYIEELAVTRLKNVINGENSGISKPINWQGGGSFIYCELMKWNENFIEKINNSENTEDLLKVYSQIKEKAFLNYKFDIEKFDNPDFKELKIEEQKEIIKKSLDLNSLYVNLSEIEDETYNISEEDKKLNKLFY